MLESEYNFKLIYQEKCPYDMDDKVMSGVKDDTGARYRFSGNAFVSAVETVYDCDSPCARHTVYVCVPSGFFVIGHDDPQKILDNFKAGVKEGLARAVKAEEKTFCRWTEDVEDECWDTGCGDRFEFIEGGPKENGAKFCLYCGKRLVAKAWKNEDGKPTPEELSQWLDHWFRPGKASQDKDSKVPAKNNVRMLRAFNERIEREL